MNSSFEQETSLNDDTVWIRETLDGHSDAFGKLVVKYQPRYFGMALRMLGSQAEAEDVLQDAFVDAYRHLADFKNKARFSTWLYSIVLNHIRNRLRHNRVLRTIPLEVETRDEVNWIPQIAENCVPSDVLCEQKFQVEAIREAVSGFPIQYQSIFTMHYFNGLSLKEISKRLNRPLGTIKAYLHRARKLLNEHKKVGAPVLVRRRVPRGLLGAEA